MTAFPLRLASLAAALLLLAGVGLAGEEKGKKEDKAAKAEKVPQIAHIRLAGDLDEAPAAADPLFGGAENFKTRLDRLHKAAADPNVQGLLIQLDGLSVGFGKLDELRKAMADARKAGKKVYAYVDGGEAKDFLAAAGADQVALPPSGWLMLVGVRAEVMFYKELFEKLGIRADFLQMGVFKFAAEPFTRSSMSKEGRAQYELVLGDFFNHSYVGPIVRGRKKKDGKPFTPDEVKKLIDEGPYTAQKALDVGLIDQIAYRDEFEKRIKKDLGAADVKIVRDYGMEKPKDLDLSNPFALLKLFSPPKAATGGKKDRIALIYAVGPIVTGKGGSSLFGGGVVGSTSMIQAIRTAEKDPKVKAIVLRVDSPGGSALASDLIWNELKACKKPVVASMSDTAASGGYYISMGAQKVYAQPGTLTGSIGVVSGKLALQGLYDKVGITTDTITFGQNAGILSGSHPFSPSERKAMEALMGEVYEQFLAKTIQGRKAAGKEFTKEQLLKLAEGRIWTGRQAKENGLVDALGGLEDAVADAKELGGLARDAEVDYLILPKGQSLFEALMERGVEGSATAGLDLTALARLPGAAPVLRDLDTMMQLRAEPVWAMMPYPVRVK